VADEFDTLVQQIIINDQQATQSLINFSNSLTMTYQKIDGLQALINVVSKQMGISFDAAKIKAMELNNAISSVGSMGGGAPGSFAFDPKLFDRVTQSTKSSTQAYKENLVTMGGLVETYPNAAKEIKQLGDNLVNTADKGKKVPPVLEDTGQKATGLLGVLDGLGQVFYHVWTAMLAFQVIQWAMNLVNGIGVAADAAQAFYKSLVNIEMGIRAMRREGVDVTMKDATKTISEFTTMFPVISKPAMTDALDNIILKTAKMGLSWKQVTDILRVAAGVYAVTGKSMENTSDAIVNAMVSSSGNMTKSLLEATNLQINSQMIEAKARELNIKSIENGVAALNAEERARTVLTVVMDQYLTKQDDISASMDTMPAKVEAVNQAFSTWKTNIGLVFLEIQANLSPTLLTLISYLELLASAIQEVFIFPATAGDVALSKITEIESRIGGIFSQEQLVRIRPEYSEYSDINNKTTDNWKKFIAALEKAEATAARLRLIPGYSIYSIMDKQTSIMANEGGPYGKLYAEEFLATFSELMDSDGYESAFDSGETLGEGIIAGMSESDRASLDTAKATAKKILDLKYISLDEEKQAELETAQETAREILAINGRMLDEKEQAALDAAKKSAEDILKINNQLLIDRTDWAVMYTGLETTEEKANATFELIKGLIKDIPIYGGLAWEQFAGLMGETSPEAVRVFAEIFAAYIRLMNRIKENPTVIGINVALQQFTTEMYGKLPPPPNQTLLPGEEIGNYGYAMRNGVLTLMTHKVPEYDSEGNLTYSYHAGGGFIPVGGIGVVGDAPGRRTGYEELVQPMPGGGAMVYNQSHMSGFSAFPPSNGADAKSEINIVVHNPIPRAAEDSISRELISLNYLGITK
jgi:hypothetical protein